MPPTAEQLARQLRESQIEILSVGDARVRVAERVRHHVMDAAVEVLCAGEQTEIRVAARAQRSDHPESVTADSLFEAVRSSIGASLLSLGFVEALAQIVEVPDPSDPERPLDTWYEVTYAAVVPMSDCPATVRRVLLIERYLAP